MQNSNRRVAIFPPSVPQLQPVPSTVFTIIPRFPHKSTPRVRAHKVIIRRNTHLETRIALTMNSICHFRQIAIRFEPAGPVKRCCNRRQALFVVVTKGRSGNARSIRKLESAKLFPVKSRISQNYSIRDKFRDCKYL